jgi:hypothetical protein
MDRETVTAEQLELLLSKDPATAIAMLEKQVERAKILLHNRPIRSADYLEWLNSTRECLVKIFGSTSPNIKTILYAPGKTVAWMGMPNAVHDRYRASSVEHKIDRLNGCILRLKREMAMSSKGSGGPDSH